METIFVKPAKLERKWFVIDAQDKALGRVAAKAASIVRGKEKPIFAPHQEMGDFVVIVNAGKAALTGRKPVQKLYRHHTGYVGGLKEENYERLAARHPAAPMELAVKGMLPKGPLGRKLAKNVKVYAGAKHPHEAQNPTPIGV
ncbi:MAG: 50S ribosomal protein L13 [Treponema sp.]|jgi:large subunit ribosomal protein L13|nr:50S ribosomal protein L13 [Treponema sp.]